VYDLNRDYEATVNRRVREIRAAREAAGQTPDVPNPLNEVLAGSDWLRRRAIERGLSFFTLSKDLVLAMHAEGLKWGVTFTSVDLHHFELEARPPGRPGTATSAPTPSSLLPREEVYGASGANAEVTERLPTRSPEEYREATRATSTHPSTPAVAGISVGDESSGWLRRAVERNAILSSRLGWESQIDEIVSHFQYLGFVPPGQTPNTETFATAVRQYQQRNPRLGNDGILGPNTWHQLRADLTDRSTGEQQRRREISGRSRRGNEPFSRAEQQIELRGLSGLERMMARIHNDYGSFLQEKSRELGIDVADAAAFLKVESGGEGFSSGTGRMIIRFENHQFYDLWGKNNREQFQQHFQFNAGTRRLGHKFRSNPSEEFADVHTGQNREWEVLEFARNLNEETALQSISMGIAQILGKNYALVGYASAREMFDDMSGRLEAQTEGLFTYIARRRRGIIVRALQAKDYTLAARYYNGRGKEDLYGNRLRSAAEAYARVVRSRIL
jgi:hypothetical protein